MHVTRYTPCVTCPGYVMTGSWEYIGPDGKLYRTEFTADNEGYKPRWGREAKNIFKI